MSTRIEPTKGSGTNVGKLQVYARLDAHVNGDGGGGTQNAGGNTGVIDARTGIPVVYSTNTTTEAANRSYAVPTYMAMTATSAGEASVGYEGTASDGLTQLDAAHALTPTTSAADGHIVATENVTPQRGSGGAFTLALGFGRSQQQAVDTATASLRTPFPFTALAYANTWNAYDLTLNRPPRSVPGQSAQTDPQDLLPRRERAEGQRGQDVPGRGGRLARLALGPGDQRGRRRQRQAGLLRLLPGGLRPRLLRGLHRLPGRRRPGHRPRPGQVPARRPAAADRRDTAQLAAQRQSRAGHRRRPAGRDRRPDPDGLPVRARRRRHAVDGAHQAGRGLPGRARPVVRRGAVGGAVRVLALDDRGRDRRPDRRRRHRGRAPRRRGRAGLPGHRGRLPAQRGELDGHLDRARQLRRPTSSGCPRPATRTPRSPTT